MKKDRVDLAFISADLWSQVQERFALNGRVYGNGKRQPKKQYLLSGMPRCSLCGASLVLVGKTTGGELRYGCSVNWSRSKALCKNNVRLKRRELEEVMVKAVFEQLITPEVMQVAIDKLKQKIQSQAVSSNDKDKILRQQIAQTQQGIKNLVDVRAKGTDAPDAVVESIREKEKLAAELKYQLDNRLSFKGIENLEIDPEWAAAEFQRFTQLWHDDVIGAGERLARIIGLIEVTPKTDNEKKYAELRSKANLSGLFGLEGFSPKNKIAGAGFEPATFGL